VIQETRTTWGFPMPQAEGLKSCAGRRSLRVKDYATKADITESTLRLELKT